MYFNELNKEKLLKSLMNSEVVEDLQGLYLQIPDPLDSTKEFAIAIQGEVRVKEKHLTSSFDMSPEILLYMLKMAVAEIERIL